MSNITPLKIIFVVCLYMHRWCFTYFNLNVRKILLLLALHNIVPIFYLGIK